MPTGKKKPAKAPGKTPKGASPKMKDVVKSAMLMEGGTKAPNMATPESRLPPPFDSKKRLGLTEVPSISEIRSDGTSGSADTSHGITGPNSAYVVLVSSDFHEFVVNRSAAYMSPTLRRMLVTQKQDLKPWNVSEFLVNYP